AGAAGAKGCPDRDLLAAAEGTREEQVAYVRAGDEEDEPDRRQQHHQRRPDVADDLVPERYHGGAPARVGLRIRLLQAFRDDLELRSSLGELDPGPEPGDGLLVVVLAHGALVVGEAERHPDLAGRREPGG